MRSSALLLVAVLAACTQAPAREEERGHARPTIVSLNPCSDAVLAEVAEPSQILGLSHYSFDPASSSMDVDEARRFRSVGDSAEEVLALRPDVVVAGTYLAPATVAALRRSGTRLVQLPIARSVAESRAQVGTLARLSGSPGAGDRLVGRINAALASAAGEERSPVSALVWQSGGIVAGNDTLIADILAQAGFSNATAARGLRQADYLPLEAMIADPPAVILAAGDRLSGEDRLLSHPALARLPGVRRESLDPSLLWCGGPTIIRAAERLAAIRSRMTGAKPLPLAGGVRGGQLRFHRSGPPPSPPAGGRGET